MYKFALLFFVFPSVFSDRTFTIVLDTTNSMNDELNIIRANINQVLNSVKTNDFGNFVLASFNDTGLPNIFVTTSAFNPQSNRKLITHLNELRTSGGNKCPENSLTGIEAALRASPGKQSIIFVFTDAYAYDYDKFESVEKLCKETHSQVIIFLSGYCSRDYIDSSYEGNVDVYYYLAKSCPGAVLRFELINDLRQAFRFMVEIANADWTDIKTFDFTDFHSFSFSVDSFTTDFILVATGDNPSIDTTITYPGISSRNAKMDTVLHTKHALVMRLLHPAEIGHYTASIRGHGKMTVTAYERNFIPFEFGFSTQQARNIRETSPRPIPGSTNYILISVDRSIKLRSLEWLVDGDSVKTILYVRELSPGLYAGSIYVHPEKSFRFWIIGEDIDTRQQVKSPSKFLKPQTLVNNASNKAPEADILDKDLGLIEYKTALTLACRVNAHPKPSIQWKDDDGNYLASEEALLEIPFTYISYVTIKVSKNSTITCNAQNYEGTASKSIDLFVNRTYTFDVIQTPQDATVEYESSHRLYCEVDAYPKANIHWYQNDTLLNAYNSRIAFEDNSIMIKRMDFEDVGEYECRASNEVETRNLKAYVQISGLDLPELEDTINTDYTLKVGDSADIECRITKGKPTPQITWKYKSLLDYDFTDLPFGVSVNGAKLHINSVETRHVGVYRCAATNLMGEDTLDFNVNIKYPPVIKDIDQNTRIVVKELNEVRLSCDVEASPKADVRWQFIKDGILKSFSQDHRTDENYSHYFMAQSSDSGEYHCIAENEVGTAEKIVTVIVQVRPYIRSPDNELIQAVKGASVDLVCQVVEGYPAPTIEWDFQAEESSAYNVFNRGNSTLHLADINEYNAGTYVCNAKNSLGFDNIRYRVIVH